MRGAGRGKKRAGELNEGGVKVIGSRNAVRLIATGIIGILIAGGDLRPARAAAIQNSATGTVAGSSLALGNATITLNSVPSASAVTSVVAEISPNAVAMGSAGNVFIYDVLPAIGGSDTGVDRAAITAPAGYANLTATGGSVRAAPALPN